MCLREIGDYLLKRNEKGSWRPRSQVSQLNLPLFSSQSSSETYESADLFISVTKLQNNQTGLPE
jgi:hypothetical protein